MVELLWRPALSFKSTDWQSDVLIRPYLAFQDSLTRAVSHALPALSVNVQQTFRIFLADTKWAQVPEGEDTRTSKELRKRVNAFRLFDQTKIFPDVSSGERMLLEDQIVDLIYAFRTDHKGCTKFLLALIPNKASPPHFLIEVPVQLSNLQ